MQLLQLSPRLYLRFLFFFSSRRRHTRWPRDWSSDVCSSDLLQRDGAHVEGVRIAPEHNQRGEYAAAVVNDAPHEEAAQEFLEFLTGATAAHIYAEFGFDVPR